MKKREKRENSHRGRAMILCMILAVTLTALPAVPAGAAVWSRPAAPAAAAASAVGLSEQEQIALPVISGKITAENAASARGTIWDKIREKLPEIDLSGIDRASEKEKFREAVRTMDDMGISPEMLVKRAWSFLSRKENREKIDQAVDGVRDKVEDVTGGKSGDDKDTGNTSGNGAGSVSEAGSESQSDPVSAEKGKNEENRGNEENDIIKAITDEAGELTQKVAEEMTEQAAEEIKEQALKKLEN